MSKKKAKRTAAERAELLAQKPISLHGKRCRCDRCTDWRKQKLESFNCWIGVLFDEVK